MAVDREEWRVPDQVLNIRRACWLRSVMTLVVAQAVHIHILELIEEASILDYNILLRLDCAWSHIAGWNKTIWGVKGNCGLSVRVKKRRPRGLAPLILEGERKAPRT